MPRTPQVASLRGACLRNIAHNMDSLWCADYIDNFLDQGQFVQVIGPFETFPPPLVMALLETLCELNMLKRHHLHLLLNNNLRKLDMAALRPFSTTNNIMRIINWRCTGLRELNLSGCKQVSAQVLCEMAECFPQLVKLDLSSTKCSDQVLTILAHHCYDLRELKVSGCPVTNMGVVNLCVTFPRDNQKMPKLARLDINDTMVGLKGVIEALTNLPNLQWLSHPMLCTALGYIHGDHVLPGGGVAKDKQYKLVNLELRTDSGTLQGENLARCMHTACALCPHVNTVKMECRTDPVVDGLSTLTNLRSLELIEEMSTDFDANIMGLLQLRGAHLTFLHLAEVDMIDLGIIGLTCPELRHLTLTYSHHSAIFIQNYNPQATQQAPCRPFSKLLELQLLFFVGATITPEILSSVLVCTVNLKKLSLVSVQGLNDEVIHDVLNVHQLEHLERLDLLECNDITGDAIFPLLQTDNALSNVRLLHCKQITRAHYDEFIRLIENKRYMVELTWA